MKKSIVAMGVFAMLAVVMVSGCIDNESLEDNPYPTLCKSRYATQGCIACVGFCKDAVEYEGVVYQPYSLLKDEACWCIDYDGVRTKIW